MKSAIRRALNAIGIEIRRSKSVHAPLTIHDYRSGLVPVLSKDYIRIRYEFARETLYSPVLMTRFREGKSLPSGFGYAIDERCVEYPWVFSKLPCDSATVLDAGSTFNFEFLLDTPLLKNKTVHILTLGPEQHCFWKRGVSYIFDDLRSIPFRDELYDVIVCISTLEHVGLNNTAHFVSSRQYQEEVPESFVDAVKELRRVLKEKGELLITVPYGKYLNIGTLQQFDHGMIERVVEAFHPTDFTIQYFRYTDDGWNFALESECRDAEFVPWVMLPADQRANSFPIQQDGAVAARAVACLSLKK